MIMYKTPDGMRASIKIINPDCFVLEPFEHSEYTHMMDRTELAAMRAIIDQALNTSAEELGDDV